MSNDLRSRYETSEGLKRLISQSSTTNLKMSCVRYWITGWLMLCLAGPKICDSQSSHWVPSYYNHYPTESNDRVKFNVPLAVPSKTNYQSFRSVDSENYFSTGNNLNFPPHSSSYDYVTPSEDIQNQENDFEENTWDEQDILEKMEALERILSDESNGKDLETKNSTIDQIISESLMPEETRRAVRQARKEKPAFFWTLARLAFETYNDTKSAVKQISTIVNNAIELGPTTRRPTTSDSLVDSTKMSTTSVRNESTTQSATEAATTMRSTTSRPKLTINDLQTLIRRNVKGLIRLFNIEWQDALKQSDITVDEFKKDLGKQVGMFLQNNPNAS
ncbi:hypothetical protein KPH14_006968 [Odynerus spinipes]|uniref:Uncharacterized protein n=1 Tax=Odynerus spinipes TaxID=1348599 RepID=A0AAD9RSL8_9HYME|nr:hypothetical protein KPH14_006968 [Odynerus spinipes]